MNSIRFSVIMSVYKKDNPVWLKEALDSLLIKQTVKPNEIVLVIDGPIGDDINTVINDYCVQYGLINVVRLKENKGLGNALKVAVENANNEYIARMDSDDISVPDRFEKEIEFLTNNPDVDVVGGDIAEFIDNPENTIAVRKVPLTDTEIKKYIKKRCPMNHVSVMFKRDSILKVGGYLDCFCNEDYYLWIRMWEEKMIFANTGEILVNVRVGREMYARRGGKKYYESEKFLQKYMLDKKLIGCTTCIRNIIIRYIVEVAMSNGMRSWFYKKIARK